MSVGAEPLALVDNLNFASPERPEIYWSFAETVRGGLADAARAFGLAYVSGNVSFYNEVVDRPIKPTPVVAGLGKVELEKIPGFGLKEGLLIGIVGVTKKELGGSELYTRLGLKGGIAPRVNLELEKANAEGILEAIRRGGLVKAVHDVSKGGIAVALAEMAVWGNTGFTVDLSEVPAEMPNPVEVAFSESHGRYLVVFPPEERLEELKTLFRHFAVIGRAGGSDAVFLWNGEEILRKPVSELKKVHESLPKLLGEEE